MGWFNTKTLHKHNIWWVHWFWCFGNGFDGTTAVPTTGMVSDCPNVIASKCECAFLGSCPNSQLILVNREQRIKNQNCVRLLEQVHLDNKMLSSHRREQPSPEPWTLPACPSPGKSRSVETKLKPVIASWSLQEVCKLCLSQVITRASPACDIQLRSMACLSFSEAGRRWRSLCLYVSLAGANRSR